VQVLAGRGKLDLVPVVQEKANALDDLWGQLRDKQRLRLRGPSRSSHGRVWSLPAPLLKNRGRGGHGAAAAAAMLLMVRLVKAQWEVLGGQAERGGENRVECRGDDNVGLGAGAVAVRLLHEVVVEVGVLVPAGGRRCGGGRGREGRVVVVLEGRGEGRRKGRNGRRRRPRFAMVLVVLLLLCATVLWHNDGERKLLFTQLRPRSDPARKMRERERERKPPDPKSRASGNSGTTVGGWESTGRE